MVTQQERTFRPGQTAQSTIRLVNTGNVPTTFIIEVAQGSSPLFGPFISEGPPVRIITPVVQPNTETAVRIPVPLSDIEGAKDFQVRIGQAGPTGGFLNVLDEKVFSGLAKIEEITMLPPPDEIIPEVLPPEIEGPENLASRFSTGLGTPQLSLDKTRVAPGEVIRGQLTIPNASGLSFAPLIEVNIAILGTVPPFAIQEVRTIVPPRSITLSPNQTISQPLTINTAGLPIPDSGEIPYDLRIVLLDTTTGIILLDARLQDIFTIVIPEVPEDLGRFPGEEELAGLPPEDDLLGRVSPFLPTPEPGLGDLTMTARFAPDSILQGEEAGFTLGVFNLQNFDISVNVTANLIDEFGMDVAAIVGPRTLTIEEDSQRVSTTAFSTRGIDPGVYGVRVIGTVASTGITILDEIEPGLLTVNALTITEAPPQLPPRDPAEFRDLQWGEPRFDPGALAEDRTTGAWNVEVRGTIINLDDRPWDITVSYTTADGRRVTKTVQKSLLAGASDTFVLSVALPENSPVGPWERQVNWQQLGGTFGGRGGPDFTLVGGVSGGGGGSFIS